jgi:hypothetical protein
MGDISGKEVHVRIDWTAQAEYVEDVFHAGLDPGMQ